MRWRIDKKQKSKEICREKEWPFFGLQKSWIKTFKPQKKVNQSFKKNKYG